MIRAVLIDIDNTIYAYAPCHAAGLGKAWRAARKHLGIAWSESEFVTAYKEARDQLKRRIHGQAASHCRLLYFEILLEVKSGAGQIAGARQLADAYWEGYFSRLTLFPHCRRTLRVLAADGIRIAWVSNFTTERQILKLEALKLDTLGFLVTSEEAGRDKPDAAVFRLALEKLKVSASETIVVGDDRDADILPSIKLGSSAVWLNPGQMPSVPPLPQVSPCNNWREVNIAIAEIRCRSSSQCPDAENALSAPATLT